MIKGNAPSATMGSTKAELITRYRAALRIYSGYAHHQTADHAPSASRGDAHSDDEDAHDDGDDARDGEPHHDDDVPHQDAPHDFGRIGPNDLPALEAFFSFRVRDAQIVLVFDTMTLLEHVVYRATRPLQKRLLIPTAKLSRDQLGNWVISLKTNPGAIAQYETENGGKLGTTPLEMVEAVKEFLMHLPPQPDEDQRMYSDLVCRAAAMADVLEAGEPVRCNGAIYATIAQALVLYTCYNYDHVANELDMIYYTSFSKKYLQAMLDNATAIERSLTESDLDEPLELPELDIHLLKSRVDDLPRTSNCRREAYMAQLLGAGHQVKVGCTLTGYDTRASGAEYSVGFPFARIPIPRELEANEHAQLARIIEVGLESLATLLACGISLLKGIRVIGEFGYISPDQLRAVRSGRRHDNVMDRVVTSKQTGETRTYMQASLDASAEMRSHKTAASAAKQKKKLRENYVLVGKIMDCGGCGTRFDQPVQVYGTRIAKRGSGIKKDKARRAGKSKKRKHNMHLDKAMGDSDGTNSESDSDGANDECDSDGTSDKCNSDRANDECDSDGANSEEDSDGADGEGSKTKHRTGKTKGGRNDDERFKRSHKDLVFFHPARHLGILAIWETRTERFRKRNQALLDVFIAKRDDPGYKPRAIYADESRVGFAHDNETHIAAFEREIKTERPFACKHVDHDGKICGARFKQKADLAYHEKRHQGEIKKPHKCQVPGCGYAGDRPNLKAHVNAVHNKPDKNWKCRSCTQVFHTHETLIAHLKRGYSTCRIAYPNNEYLKQEPEAQFDVRLERKRRRMENLPVHFREIRGARLVDKGLDKLMQGGVHVHMSKTMAATSSSVATG
ncbi:hypothetical protein GGF31_003762, partial [Allomyces arbusculus]